jgi:hypothetical protein
MGYNIKDEERNEHILFVSEAIGRQTKVIEKQNYELSKIGTQVSNIAYSLGRFTGLHLTMNEEPIFIPVDKIIYIVGNKIKLVEGTWASVDQSHEEIMEEIAVSC